MCCRGVHASNRLAAPPRDSASERHGRRRLPAAWPGGCSSTHSNSWVSTTQPSHQQLQISPQPRDLPVPAWPPLTTRVLPGAHSSSRHRHQQLEVPAEPSAAHAGNAAAASSLPQGNAAAAAMPPAARPPPAAGMAGSSSIRSGAPAAAQQLRDVSSGSGSSRHGRAARRRAPAAGLGRTSAAAARQAAAAAVAVRRGALPAGGAGAGGDDGRAAAQHHLSRCAPLLPCMRPAACAVRTQHASTSSRKRSAHARMHAFAS